MSSLDQLEMAVIRWAEARKIIPRSTPQAQLCKLLEEVGELAEGINKGKPEKIKDSIGDALVVLIILSDLHGLSLRQCLTSAYEEIRTRRGTLGADGIFVKEEPRDDV